MQNNKISYFSYSDMKAKDNRGKAVSAVLINGKELHVRGILSSGAEIKYHTSLEAGKGDQYIGKRVKLPTDSDDNGFWVKAKLAAKEGMRIGYY